MSLEEPLGNKCVQHLMEVAGILNSINATINEN